MGKENELQGNLVELPETDGLAFIEQGTPLTRLHYFDGKFLRADAFALEQDYHRTRTRLANLAGGWGAVHGLGISLSGNQLEVGAGLAITAAGNFVLANSDLNADLADLIAVARPADASGNSEFADCPPQTSNGITEGTGLNIYEITVGPVDGLCGQEAVFGKLCESACVSSSQHPYWREGVVLRLRPISLNLPASSAVTLGKTHLRNRVASAYFAAEPWLTPPALSAAGLANTLWCEPAQMYGRDEVVIGLLVRDGGVNRVIDAWSGRRERMDAQARGYWQGRMAMRPWNVFVAQILQFQCQLAATFDGGGVIALPDDCDNLRELLDSTRKELETLQKRYESSTKDIIDRLGGRATKAQIASAMEQQMGASNLALFDLSATLSQVELGQGALPSQRMLIHAGFVELPPAGYLPVVPGKQPVETQMARLFGEGVQLHYHAVRHDEIAHLVEEAQHMERISLTRGLDNPADIEAVEIFVPDGEVLGVTPTSPGEWWQVDMDLAALGAFSLGLEPTGSDNGVDAMPTTGISGLRRTGAFTLMRAGTSTAGADNTAFTINSFNVNTAAAVEVDTDLEAARQQLAALIQSLTEQPVAGLARTEGRDDGSYGFTLVGRIDATAIIADIKRLTAKYPQLADNAILERIDALARAALYLSGDIDADPMALPMHASTQLKGEMALSGQVIPISGKLTVLYDRSRLGGDSERVVQLNLIVVTSNGQANAVAGPVSLMRNGNAADGRFVLDDAAHDDTTSPTFFDWESSPRQARMSILDDDNRVAGLTMMRLNRDGMTLGASANNASTTATAAAASETLVARDGAPHRTLATFHGLDAMPATDSALGAAALNALVSIAETAEDPAFFVRARQRLFPTLDTPVDETVRAVRDWVMFRRARTHLCCPQIPPPPVTPAIELFQVWHLAVASDEEFNAVRKSLDQGDGSVLQKLGVKRVGVLRYREQNTAAEETEAQVEAMWTQAAPAPQVVLGRYWEETPVTGQGWQNHFRLNFMLDQISEITNPPPSGSGAIARQEPVPPPLQDGAMDGGFLVVTRSVEITSRRALLIYGGWDRPNHFLTDDAPQANLDFANNAPQGSTLADFIAALTPNQPVLGVTVATVQAPSDAGAGTRLASVINALVAAGKPAPAASRQTVDVLSDHDRRQLVSIGVQPDDYDDIVFFELNAGS